MNARAVALKVIQDVTVRGAYANIALTKELAKQRELSGPDRRLVTELVYGTLKAQGTLDWALSHFLNRPLSKLTPVIRDILRMGVYQLLFLDRIPPSAACNEAVELAKRNGHIGVARFVNGVLRSLLRQPEKIAYPDAADDAAVYLSLRHLHPRWLVERWLAQLGFEATEALCRFNNQPPPLSIRTNLQRISREALQARLAEEGVRCEPSLLAPEGLLLLEAPPLTSLASFREGLYQVQDESSMLVAHVVAPQPGETIIDACAAPGGKTTHLAERMQNKGTIWACDVHAHKMDLLQDNADRLGLQVIHPSCLDARDIGKTWPAQADRLLVDAPCSGLGVLRRRADARWRKEISQIEELTILQREILEGAAPALKVGGILVYSTCTVEPAENRQTIEWFLARHPEFELEDAGSLLPVPRQGEPMVQLWPHIDGTDGFFLCRLRKVKDVAV